MFKKLSCIAVVILCFILCCCIFAGCADGGNKYHAELDSHAYYLMNKDFIKEHKVYGAYYDDGNPQEGDEILGENAQRVIHYFDRTSPETHTYIIDNETQFTSIFTQYSGQIDFDNKIVIMYMYCTNTIIDYRLKEIIINKETAEIYYEINPKDKTRHPMIESSPRCFMVILDKVDIQTAQFIKV